MTERRQSPAHRAQPTSASSERRIVEVARLEIAGYLGRDAQIITTSEREFVALSVGTSRSWPDRTGQLQHDTLWVKVLAFGAAATALRDLKKGAPLYAAGPLSYDRWDDSSGPRHAPVLRVSEREGEAVSAPMPGGQYARVMLAGTITRDATIQHPAPEAGTPAAARFGVHARAAHVVVVQGALVEHVAERLKAGHGVRVEGRLELRRWRDAQGKPHERIMVVVGGPESTLRVDRTPLPKLGPEPRPEPMPDLDPPTAMQSPDRADRRPR